MHCQILYIYSRLESPLSTVVAIHVIKVLFSGHGSCCSILRQSRQVWSAGPHAVVRWDLSLLFLVPHSLPLHLCVSPRVETAQSKIAVLSLTTRGRERFHRTLIHGIFLNNSQLDILLFVLAGLVHELWAPKRCFQHSCLYWGPSAQEPCLRAYMGSQATDKKMRDTTFSGQIKKTKEKSCNLS